MAIILVVALAGAFGGTACAWATGPYFTALPESGETEMHVARFAAVAAPLPSGQVLIAGGENGSGGERSAELFDPATNTFTLLPESGATEMRYARYRAVAAPLPDGELLIAGGHASGPDGSAGLFSPAADSFTLLPESVDTEMSVARAGALAAPLPSGQVLIGGGSDPKSDFFYVGSAELFDPAADTFTALPGGELALHTSRFSDCGCRSSEREGIDRRWPK